VTGTWLLQSVYPTAAEEPLDCGAWCVLGLPARTHLTRASIISLLMVSSVWAAAGSVRAITIEGKAIEAVFSGVDPAGAILLERSGATTALPPATLMSLRWADSGPVGPPGSLPVVVYLADGSRMPARIIGGDARHLELQTCPAPRLKIPLAELAALRFATPEHAGGREAFDKALADRDPSQDTLFVLRGDRLAVLRGVTESLGPAGGSFRWRNRSVPIAPDTVYGLVFAAGLTRAPRTQAVCRLRDASIWAGRITGGSAEKIALELAGGLTITLEVSQLMEIQFQSDRVVFLDDLEPASYQFEPFAVTRWPYRVNRSAANRPIRIGDEHFARGIGVHSQATLVYRLPDGFSRFAAVIGIDEAVGPLGSVVFRVMADDREVFNSGPVTGGDPPRPILVPIHAARRLQLTVDFGDRLDVGDQADWAEARLIK